ncbi:unnamed protein product [Blepharisma stoltei]|uniref:Uncharacterized protein n=1 Tax=Blepharisma stoltei TaxID=1481888 RepID=A0AAU9JGP3_9CILI|nr:unnamed protein product [Blepharisma stoltei]
MDFSRRSIQRYYRDESMPSHIKSFSVELPEVISPKSFAGAMLSHKEGDLEPLKDFMKKRKMIQAMMSPQDISLNHGEISPIDIHTKIYFECKKKKKNMHRKIMRLKLPTISYLK